MSLVDVLNINKEKVDQINLNDEIFNVEVKRELLHEIVKMQLLSRRLGTASAKRRSDISGSTRKIMRQKGTGNARRGNIKSPLLRGGGVVFGPIPKSYAYGMPKKKKRLGLKMALSDKYNNDKLIILDEFPLEKIKTKDFVTMLDNLDRKNVLIIIKEKNEKLELSSRNLAKVKVLRTEGLNVYDLLKYNYLIILKDSLEKIEGRLCR
ncbi:MAG: 50S ribosomal protein L4 [Deltaproteobacteria bacterium]|nr:50S ribosomal protein L4 [Deltaproteobacteria bacterium]